MKRFFKKMNQKGFSLIELMIVVAIIGVLAAIAVPNYQKFVRKSKQAEAKSLLSGYYTSAKATMAEYGYHIGNFPRIGFNPEGELTYRLQTTDSGQAEYNNAVSALDVAGCISTENASNVCAVSDSGNNLFEPRWSNLAVGPQATGTVTASGKNTFEARAAADIGGSQTDEWTIDDRKDMNIISDGTEN
ncbi:MAG: type IV pilin protein [Bdellovibrionales bacterium]